MNPKSFNTPALQDTFRQQIFSQESQLRKNAYALEDAGDYIPGNVFGYCL